MSHKGSNSIFLIDDTVAPISDNIVVEPTPVSTSDPHATPPKSKKTPMDKARSKAKVTGISIAKKDKSITGIAPKAITGTIPKIKKTTKTKRAAATEMEVDVPMSPDDFKTLIDMMGADVDNSVPSQKYISDEQRKYLESIDWETGFKRAEIKKFQPVWEDVCDTIIKIPLISDVVRLNINVQDKAEFVHKLIILYGLPFDSFEFIQMRKMLSSQYQRYASAQYSQAQLKEYTDMEKEMSQYADGADTHASLKYSILGADLSKKNKAFVYMRYHNFNCAVGEDGGKIKTWIQTAISIPNNMHTNMITSAKKTPRTIDKYLRDIKATLDTELYGMNQIKEKLLFFINNKIVKGNTSGGALALEGLPGIGKTCIIQALAKALDLPMTCIPIGGAKDAAFLNGHGFTYEGSTPGAIVQALQELKCKNGIIFIDEIDKIPQTEKGSEISKALLHIIDPSQNFAYHDRYLTNQFDVDLSKIWFIYTLNDRNNIERTLRDRIPIINVPGYTFKEKAEIMRIYIVPASLANAGIDVAAVQFSDEAIRHLIQTVTQNKMEICDHDGKSGVRQLKYIVDHLVMKINLLRSLWAPKFTPTLHLSFKIAGFKLPLIVTPDVIKELGIDDFQHNENIRHMTMYS